MSAFDPPLILPVENQVREFDGKLLLACAAAERGFDVLIGSLTFIEFLLPFVTRGVYVAKSLTPVGEKMLRLVQRLGHDIVAWDEESLVRFDAPDYCNWRYSRGAFALTDRLFAWGADDAALFAGYCGDAATPIHPVGNPRLDLLRPELREYFRPQVDALRQAHGDFILINTNFAFVNNFVTDQNLWQGAGRGEFGQGPSRTGRGMTPDYAQAKAAHVQAIYAAFQQLVPQLARWFGDRRIVIRPHPSERFDTWRAFEREHANVQVLHEGSAVPWLMACGVLVHNGCTTAVEAAVLDRPAVAYRPVLDPAHDYALPNGLSHDAVDEHSVRDLVADILAGRRGLIEDDRRRSIFARHLAGVDGPLAVDRIVDVLAAQYSGRPSARPRSGAAWLRANGRTALKLGTMLRPHHRNSLRYHRQRFPTLANDEVRARIARMARLLGRFADVESTAYAPHVFRISGRGSSGN